LEKLVAGKADEKEIQESISIMQESQQKVSHAVADFRHDNKAF
jgi:hypothetical protein